MEYSRFVFQEMPTAHTLSVFTEKPIGHTPFLRIKCIHLLCLVCAAVFVFEGLDSCCLVDKFYLFAPNANQVPTPGLGCISLVWRCQRLFMNSEILSYNFF